MFEKTCCDVGGQAACDQCDINKQNRQHQTSETCAKNLMILVIHFIGACTRKTRRCPRMKMISALINGKLVYFLLQEELTHCHSKSFAKHKLLS